VKRAGNADIIPTKWERALVNYPCAVMGVCLLFVILLIGILVGVGFPAFSGGGFNARTTETQARVDAMDLLGDDNGVAPNKYCDFSRCAVLACSDISNDFQVVSEVCGSCDHLERCNPQAIDYASMRAQAGDTSRRLLTSVPERKLNENCIGGNEQQIFTYEADDGNMLTEDNLKRLCQFERLDLINKIPEYRDYCEKESLCFDECGTFDPTIATDVSIRGLCSANPGVYGCKNIVDPSGKSSLSIISPQLGLFTNDLSKCELSGDWEAKLAELATGKLGGEPLDEDTLNLVFDKDFRSTYKADKRLVSRYMRSKIVLSGNNAWDWKEDVLLVEIGKLGLSEKCNGLRAFGCTKPPVSLYVASDADMQNQMNQDMMLAGFSIVAVFFYMWYNTKSIFLTCCGM
jgi:hypothetical protein